MWRTECIDGRMPNCRCSKQIKKFCINQVVEEGSRPKQKPLGVMPPTVRGLLQKWKMLFTMVAVKRVEKARQKDQKNMLSCASLR